LVPESVSDQQRPTGLHHGLAIKPGIERREFVRFVGIPFGLAGYEYLDVRGIYSHYQGRRHVHDFGE
jgi:hypothetical protein